MSFKKDFKKSFNDKEIFSKLRYESAKNFFIYSALVFFINYFFVGARFLDDIFVFILPFTFIIFLVSFSVYFYMYFSKKFKLSLILNLLLIIFLIILTIAFLYPFIGIDLVEQFI